MKRIVLFAFGIASTVATLEVVRGARVEVARAEARLEDLAELLRLAEARLDRCEAELNRSDMLLAGRKRLPQPERLALKLSVSPRSGIAPLTVQASIRVIDPEPRKLLCPQFTLLAKVGDEPPDYTSGFAGDVRCAGEGPRVHAPRPRLIPLRRAGEWVIHASLADHGLTLHDRQTVTVLGRAE